MYLSKENQLCYKHEHIVLCFKVEIGSVCSKEAFYAKMEKNMYLSKENQLC
jgi:hypothetical protein